MIAMEAVSYLLFCVYLVSFFGLSAMAAREAGRSVWLFSKGKEPQTLPAWLFRIAFAGAAIRLPLQALQSCRLSGRLLAALSCATRFSQHLTG